MWLCDSVTLWLTQQVLEMLTHLKTGATEKIHGNEKHYRENIIQRLSQVKVMLRGSHSWEWSLRGSYRSEIWVYWKRNKIEINKLRLYSWNSWYIVEIWLRNSVKFNGTFTKSKIFAISFLAHLNYFYKLVVPGALVPCLLNPRVNEYVFLNGSKSEVN